MRRLVAVVAALAIVAALAATALSLPREIRGTARDDLLTGTPGRDNLQGFAGDDVLEGRGGPDALLGGPGSDVLRGGTGPDSLFGGPGPDTASGGPGHDLLKLGSDRVPDVVICGRGFDVVSVDRFDAVAEDCEVVRRALPVGSAPTPVTIEVLGWASRATDRVALLPAPAVAPGGTLTACAQGDRRLDVYHRVRGLAQRTSIRVEFDFPTGRDPVLFDSVRPREQGRDLVYSFAAAIGAPGLPNGTYVVRFQVEASGVYTPVGEATVTRACA